MFSHDWWISTPDHTLKHAAGICPPHIFPSWKEEEHILPPFIAATVWFGKKQRRERERKYSGHARFPRAVCSSSSSSSFLYLSWLLRECPTDRKLGRSRIRQKILSKICSKNIKKLFVWEIVKLFFFFSFLNFRYDFWWISYPSSERETSCPCQSGRDMQQNARNSPITPIPKNNIYSPTLYIKKKILNSKNMLMDWRTPTHSYWATLAGDKGGENMTRRGFLGISWMNEWFRDVTARKWDLERLINSD